MSNAAKKTFEDAIKRLEEIVNLLEGQTTSLEDSISLFEEGKALIEFCMEKLDAAEQKLKVLTHPEADDE